MFTLHAYCWVHPKGTPGNVREAICVGDDYPTVEAAIDVAAERGAGVYGITSNAAFVELRLTMSRNLANRWLAARAAADTRSTVPFLRLLRAGGN